LGLLDSEKFKLSFSRRHAFFINSLTEKTGFKFQTITNRFARKMAEIGTKTEPFKRSGPSGRSFFSVVALLAGPS
jgi:hypothetical protein